MWLCFGGGIHEAKQNKTKQNKTKRTEFLFFVWPPRFFDSKWMQTWRTQKQKVKHSSFHSLTHSLTRLHALVCSGLSCTTLFQNNQSINQFTCLVCFVWSKTWDSQQTDEIGDVFRIRGSPISSQLWNAPFVIYPPPVLTSINPDSAPSAWKTWVWWFKALACFYPPPFIQNYFIDSRYSAEVLQLVDRFSCCLFVCQTRWGRRNQLINMIADALTRTSLCEWVAIPRQQYQHG
jgi:hypothetical protein